MTSEQLARNLGFAGRARFVVLALGLAVQCASGQAITSENAPTEAKLPAYDIVSIKANESGSGNVDTTTKSASYSAKNVFLKNLLQHAYGIREDLIFGGPKWVNSARFDIEAKIVDPDLEALRELSPEQSRALLRPMLADRFQLKVHTETKVLSVYELVLAKGAPKFRDASLEDAAGRGEGTHIQNSVLTAHAVTLASLASTLSYQLHQTVIDKTGLTGKFDLALNWTPEYGPDASRESSAASIFTALQEQLGLKLRSSKGPVETLVIDHVEMPSEN